MLELKLILFGKGVPGDKPLSEQTATLVPFSGTHLTVVRSQNRVRNAFIPKCHIIKIFKERNKLDVCVILVTEL